MERQDQPMQKGKTGDTRKKRHDRGTLIQVLLVHSPALQGTAGHVKHLGRLTLGHPLYFQIAIPFKQVSAFEACPALVAIMIATGALLGLSLPQAIPPLLKSLPCENWRAKHGEVAPRLQSLSVSRHSFARLSSRRDGRHHDRGRIVYISSLSRQKVSPSGPCPGSLQRLSYGVGILHKSIISLTLGANQ